MSQLTQAPNGPMLARGYVLIDPPPPPPQKEEPQQQSSLGFIPALLAALALAAAFWFITGGHEVLR